MKTKTYTGEGIDVTYTIERCIHAKECVNRLAAVFDTSKRPWIQPSNADADTVADTVMHCPTGALHFERKDGGAQEPTPDENSVNIVANGPLYVHGDITISRDDGDLILKDTRVALCRCGASEHKPFCDNSHLKTDFEDTGDIAATILPNADTENGLVLRPMQDGPVVFEGEITITSADGENTVSGGEGAFCRCGGSHTKPFCDGTHAKIGFEAD